MSPPIPPLLRLGLCLALSTIALSFATATPAHSECPRPPTFVIIDRAVAQERVPQDKLGQEQKWFWQAWQVDYRLRLQSSTGLIVTPTEITAAIEGWVSNSRVPSH